MSSKPIFYNWDDVGSPGRNLTGNLQNRLKQILKACLVDGYGDKKGAGWSIGHEHPNGFSLVNGRNDFVVNFVSNLPAKSPYPAMPSAVIHIYAANSITDTSNPIVSGSNLCSGSYRLGLPEPSGYRRHMIGGMLDILVSVIGQLQWVVLADENTFIFSANVKINSQSERYTVAAYFGDFKNSQGIDTPIILGGAEGNYNAPQTNSGFHVGYSVPLDPKTGLSGNQILRASPYYRNNIVITSDDREVLPHLCFKNPRVLSGGDYVGELKGVVYDDDVYRDGSWMWGLKNLSLPIEKESLCKIVSVKGHEYCFIEHSTGPGSYLTNNPAYWG